MQIFTVCACSLQFRVLININACDWWNINLCEFSLRHDQSHVTGSRHFGASNVFDSRRFRSISVDPEVARFSRNLKGGYKRSLIIADEINHV